MSRAHTNYLSLHQQPNQSTRTKTLTGFGPAAYEERFLHEMLLASSAGPGTTGPAYFNQQRKLQFYSPAYILAPSTNTNTAIGLAASSFFFKNGDGHAAANNNQAFTSSLHFLSSIYFMISSLSFAQLTKHSARRHQQQKKQRETQTTTAPLPPTTTTSTTATSTCGRRRSKSSVKWLRLMYVWTCVFYKLVASLRPPPPPRLPLPQRL